VEKSVDLMTRLMADVERLQDTVADLPEWLWEAAGESMSKLSGVADVVVKRAQDVYAAHPPAELGEIGAGRFQSTFLRRFVLPAAALSEQIELGYSGPLDPVRFCGRGWLALVMPLQPLDDGGWDEDEYPSRVLVAGPSVENQPSTSG
jgi:hypothetical protein